MHTAEEARLDGMFVGEGARGMKFELISKDLRVEIHHLSIKILLNFHLNFPSAAFIMPNPEPRPKPSVFLSH